MINPFKPYFPWWLAVRFAIYLLLMAGSTLVCVVLWQWQPYWGAVSALIVFFGLLVGTLVFVRPFYLILLKAISISNKRVVESFSSDFEDQLALESGFVDLERALDKIRRKLKKRKEQLAFERSEFEALLTSLDEGVISIDLNEQVRFYNSRFATQFMDRTTIESTASISLAQVFRKPEVLSLFREVKANNQLSKKLLRLVSLREENLRYFAVTVSPLLDQKTKIPYGLLGVFHDVTELKKVEQVRMEFIENASHELRTPLTSIKGYVETLKEDFALGTTEQAEHFLKVISKNVNRLTDLVADMLKLSKLESQSDCAREEFATQDLTLEVIERVSALAQDKRIMIQSSCEAQSIWADYSKVDQVLQNLIGNAIKYIQVGGQIHVRWQKTHDEYLLIVQDNGPGIAEEHLSRLFERFYRVDKGRSRDDGGTGLGLAIVKHIMQTHEGYITVKSQLGVGSEFVCHFPVKELNQKLS